MLFSSQVPRELVPMVFLPLAMGALAYPSDCPRIPDEPRKPPRDFSRPKRSEPDAEATRPFSEGVLRATRTLMELKFKERWGEVGEEAVTEARVALQKSKDSLREALEEANRAADEEFSASLAEYRERLLKYRKDLSSYRAEMRAWREGCENLREKVSEWEKGCEAHFARIEISLGEVYGYYKDSIGGRAINGFPMLGVCHLLHREDWDRVREAIYRELDRDIDL